MTTQVNVVDWSKTLSLDRHVFRTTSNGFHSVIVQDEKISRYRHETEADHQQAYKSSFLYSVHLKRSLDESRRAFLSFSESKVDEEQEPQDRVENNNKETTEQKKTPSRKISFKCKKPPAYRSKVTTTTLLNASTVAQLTTKFNEMVTEKNSILEQTKFARLVRRVNSQKLTQEDGSVKKVVVRKPSVKLKPILRNEDKSVNSEKSKNKRNNSVKSVKDDKMCVHAKISYLEAPQLARKCELSNKIESGIPLKSSLAAGSVRATIEIFERRSSQSSPDIDVKKFLKDVAKPKVPEKNPNLKTKDLVIKDGVLKLKLSDKREINSANNNSNNTSTVQEENKSDETKTDIEDEVQILNIPLVMPRRCDSMYETLNLRRISPPPKLKTAKSEGTVAESTLPPEPLVKPNTSFLWRQKSQESSKHEEGEEEEDNWKSIYDTVDINPKTQEPPAIPPRPTSLNLPTSKSPTPPKSIFKKKMPLPEEPEEKIYEELGSVSHSYEYCRSPSKYEDLEEHKSDDGYEYFESISPVSNKPKQLEGIYETLPLPAKTTRKQEEPLPPRPPSRDSYDTIQNGEGVSNCYESIYNSSERDVNLNGEIVSNNYESIYSCRMRSENWEVASNRDSLISSDQQSNSLYGRSLSGWTNEDVNVYNGKASSDLSGSEKSDEWIDISDNEENSKSASGFVIVRERQRNKKTSGWSQKIRDQWNKSHSTDKGDSDSDHHYESLYNAQDDYQDNDDFDSFDSDTESESSYSKTNQNDSGVDMGNSQLPDPPSTQSYGFTRLAVSAGKHMKRLRRNWSLTKNDITKSLSRMAKRKSRTDLESIDPAKSSSTSKTQISSPIPLDPNNPLSNITQELKLRHGNSQINLAPYENVQFSSKESTEPLEQPEKSSRTNSLSKKKFLNKFRRSMSISHEAASEVTQNLGNKPKSTFYLTETIDLDDKDQENVKVEEIETSVSPKVLRNHRVASQRPSSPPPPIPIDANQNFDSSNKLLRNNKRSTSWYAECGLFRNSENLVGHNLNNKRPNTSWYAEIGLYQSSASTPSTSSTENSGNNTNINTKSPEPESLNSLKDSEEYYNLRNENGDYYNQSIASFNSDMTAEKCSNVSADIQLRLQDEPLYQFYDAAVLESVCQDGTSDFDYDGYEEVGDKANSDYSETQLSVRPSAMQLISPGKNGGVTVVRTLWCEIPEVLQSSVLSTLSVHQKKLQEAKFEMMTSEASYLNSLNVLTDHFITNLSNGDLLTREEENTLFGRIPAVKRCSEKLLLDLEKCWQENILLHGICDVIQKHAEENFYVYVSYCENQILLDSNLKKIRERSNCNELLKQLECSSACQSLSLYSFLMLPMQRITRWPLLVDAVLKRLSPQDDEYVSCQYTLATINKIVTQCNEAARKMERESEIKRIAAQIEFPRGIPLIKLVSGSRWLVKSGPLTQMHARADDIKLTFGRRFSKVPLHLFLFNDMLFVTKPRSDDCFVVLHYCYRSYIELNANDIIGSLPTRDTQGRHLLFLTILENHDGKTVEMLLSCSSESDKERWTEALSPPKSEDPNETLYECWDCPQVTAIHNYIANQPDELALSRGDIVNVTRKMADGWYHGERIRDGLVGWFPANYTTEVANPHVRARNLKQRYRLLAFSENYLKSK